MQRVPWYKNICWPIASFIIPAHIVAAIGTYFYATLHGFTLPAIIIGVVFLFLTTFSISGGYHRLFAHGTYEAHPILKIYYLIFGAASFEASALKWASDHRRHHAYIDEDQDPYNIKRGFWWAHIGWILTKDPSSQGISKVGDLERDKWIVFQHKYYVPIAFGFGLGVPLALGWLFGDPWGGLIIGGFLRLAFFYQATFSINSVAHIFGTQPYSDDDSSRDSWFTAVLTMGEGFHNFHHTFAADYRNGVNPWEYDPTKWLLNVFTWFGLAKNLIRTPEPVILKAKLRMQAKRAEARLKANPHAAEKLRIAREKLERMLDTWNAVKAEWAEETARLKGRSEELIAKLKHDLAESRARYHEAYEAWIITLRNPHLLTASGNP
ncbi:MAG TPA: fatty acid desaturase [Planctomycetota bacterium]|jgi:stearoyl-CoA desaturase (delta-9 desaturase)|nr:fatty acid desaturase [Planctomycetota bacterium]